MAETSELQFEFGDTLDTATLDNSSGEKEKLQIPRFFTSKEKHPYDLINWETRTASITNDKGEILFKLENVEVPKSWSQTAINIVA